MSLVCGGVKGAGIPGPEQPDGSTSCSPPELIGTRNKKRADQHWSKHGSQVGKGTPPQCGVPGC